MNKKIMTYGRQNNYLVLIVFLLIVIIGMGLSLSLNTKEIQLQPPSSVGAGISKYTDTEAGVLCYLYNTNRSDSISCVPLSQTRLK